MAGGAALSLTHSEDDRLACSACDQSNAFTYVLTPQWLWPFFATPPVLAMLVWHLLDEALKARIDKMTLVSAQYMRLPMGCSHSVFILMSINMRYIGMVLMSSSKIQVNNIRRSAADGLAFKEGEHVDFSFRVTDEQWWERQNKRRHHTGTAAGNESPRNFYSALRTPPTKASK